MKGERGDGGRGKDERREGRKEGEKKEGRRKRRMG